MKPTRDSNLTAEMLDVIDAHVQNDHTRPQNIGRPVEDVVGEALAERDAAAWERETIRIELEKNREAHEAPTKNHLRDKDGKLVDGQILLEGQPTERWALTRDGKVNLGTDEQENWITLKDYQANRKKAAEASVA